MANYNNPRYAQMYARWSDASKGLIPIPPCKDAYSIGPASNQTSLGVRWISSTYNFSGSVPSSKCGLIKDENDYFYHVVVYILSGNTFIYVNEYDAENDVRNDYAITEPAELATIKAGGVNNIHWLIRKKTSTLLDLVAYGQDAGTNRIIQHYTWTIGAATMSYVGGFTYDSATLGESYARILQGPLVIDVIHYNPIPPTPRTLTYKTYNLNSSVVSTVEIFDESDQSTVSWDFSVYHAGYSVYVYVVYSYVVSTVSCEWAIGQFASMNTEVRAESKCAYFLTDGSANSSSELLETRTGHHANILDIALSDDYGASPDAGYAYARLKYEWRESDDSDCSHIFSSPDRSGEFAQFIRISAGVMTQLGQGSGLTAPAGWPARDGDRAVNITSANLYSYSSRNDPISLVQYQGTTDWYLLHWVNQTATAQNVLHSGAAIVIPPPCGTGQRNDNQPELFALLSGTSNVWYTDGGSLYLTQTTTLGGSAGNFLPVTGMMGKWPVRHRDGRWAIFDPNIQEVASGHWYVV